ncbi:MAG: hypothetical protein FWG73_00765 [Planctomycetaceae bacterium]|nr:hypothetical protein [Planctomycetaceae bacterium]
MPTSTVIIKGRTERREFAEAYRQACDAFAQLGLAPQLNPSSAQIADFFLFFQSYPYEFLPSELTQLRRDNPLAPFFFVLGACCEGMQRTASPPDSPFYVYAHAWSTQDAEQIRLFLTDQRSLFSLPLTAGADEVALCRITCGIACDAPKRVGDAANCLILTHFGPFGNDAAMNLLLADEHRHLGYEPVFSGEMPPDAFSGIILADADNSPAEKILDSIQRLRCRLADNDFTVYIDSPRIDEKSAYVQAGATRVLAKMR